MTGPYSQIPCAQLHLQTSTVVKAENSFPGTLGAALHRGHAPPLEVVQHAATRQRSQDRAARPQPAPDTPAARHRDRCRNKLLMPPSWCSSARTMSAVTKTHNSAEAGKTPQEDRYPVQSAQNLSMSYTPEFLERADHCFADRCWQRLGCSVDNRAGGGQRNAD